MLILRKIGPDAIGGGGGRYAQVSDRQPADVPGSGQITLHQGGRHAQYVGDVIEAAALVVGRQELGCVDFQAEQIANGVGVLGPVEAVHGGVPRVRLGGGGSVETGFEKRGQSVQSRFIGPRHALRRHRAHAELADHLFPGFRSLGDIGQARGL